ncbi:SsgA family sporulation/cell division regulator [Streptomyces sp. NPDC059153]|uniref:SsgA family sporulation/cell division regulator n=1 Tax=Streptomyces sp. NPDC059153 TaxID=3346743 RepID=UPI00367B1B5D
MSTDKAPRRRRNGCRWGGGIHGDARRKLVLSRAMLRAFLDNLCRPPDFRVGRRKPLLQSFFGATMDQRLSTVTCTVTAHVSVPKGMPAPLSAELHYDMADPYAIRLSLGAPMKSPVDWVFARKLVTEGLRRPTGSGDVLVIPRHRCHPHSLRVVLRNLSGTALVEMAVSEVTAFLRWTFALVPEGAESLHMDLDRAISELTGRRG